MKFKAPLFFLLFLPLAWMLLRAWFKGRAGRDAAHLAIPWRKLWDRVDRSALSGAMRVPPRFWHSCFYGLACACFIAALARPQMSFEKVKRNIEGVDIMVVLDLSASMRIEDFRDQSRIDTAKVVLREFVAGRPTDRIGFQGFSGEAITLVPPTLDHSVVLQALRNINIGDIKDGTAIGDALASAVGRLKESTAKSRIIVLVTDGDSNVGIVDPLTGGELAKGYGIRIYSVAIGREGRVAMPFVQKDIFGRQVKTYQYFDNSINPELLRQISAMTGGKFYRVEDDPHVFRDVFKDIDKLEKFKIETTEQVKFDEKFMGLAWCGIFLWLAAFLLQNWTLRVYP